MFCTKCGTKIMSRGPFCVRCGHAVGMASTFYAQPARPAVRKPHRAWPYVLLAAAIVFVAAFILNFTLPGGLMGFFLPVAQETTPEEYHVLISGAYPYEEAAEAAYTPDSPAAAISPPGPVIFDIAVFAGDFIELGSHKWRVLDVEGYRALVIMERIAANLNFHHSQQAATWETSELRQYLNSDFIGSFSPEEQALIMETSVTNDPNLWFGTDGGGETTDRVFLLSIDEVLRYFGDSRIAAKGANENERGWGLAAQSYGIHNWGIHDHFSKARRAQNLDGSDMWWWLRSPGSAPNRAAIVMGGSGSLNMYGSEVFRLGESGGGIRPAMWLDARNLQRMEISPAMQAEPAQAAAPDARDNLLGVWRGTYASGHGIMGREMAVFKDGGEYVVKVWFFPTVGSYPNRPSGSLLSEVYFDMGTNAFVITNSVWVDQPPGMTLFNRGDLFLYGNTLTGVHNNRADRPINMTRAAYSNFTLNRDHSHIPGESYRTIIEATGTSPGLRVFSCVFCHIEMLQEVLP